MPNQRRNRAFFSFVQAGAPHCFGAWASDVPLVRQHVSFDWGDHRLRPHSLSPINVGLTIAVGEACRVQGCEFDVGASPRPGPGTGVPPAEAGTDPVPIAPRAGAAKQSVPVPPALTSAADSNPPPLRPRPQRRNLQQTSSCHTSPSRWASVPQRKAKKPPHSLRPTSRKSPPRLLSCCALIRAAVWSLNHAPHMGPCIWARWACKPFRRSQSKVPGHGCPAIPGW